MKTAKERAKELAERYSLDITVEADIQGVLEEYGIEVGMLSSRTDQQVILRLAELQRSLDAAHDYMRRQPCPHAGLALDHPRFTRVNAAGVEEHATPLEFNRENFHYHSYYVDKGDGNGREWDEDEQHACPYCKGRGTMLDEFEAAGGKGEQVLEKE